MAIRKRVGPISLLFLLLACTKVPDIQGQWFFDYEQTKPTEFPNTHYESARALITDIEPRYGVINVEADTVVLGGAVCKILKINDKNGLSCTERNKTSLAGFYYENERLIVQPQDRPDVRLVFLRSRQDPEKLYGIALSTPPVEEHSLSAEQLSIPSTAGSSVLVGVARTASFDAFYDPASVVSDGRNNAVTMILNYLEPQNQSESAVPANSSVQFLTFDCPGSNYQLNRFVMYGESNGTGAVLSDSGVISPATWKPVPENSVNKALYMRVCR